MSCANKDYLVAYRLVFLYSLIIEYYVYIFCMYVCYDLQLFIEIDIEIMPLNHYIVIISFTYLANGRLCDFFEREKFRFCTGNR